MNSQPKILITKPARGYELLDSGEGEKLERFGEFVIRRPDPQALWKKGLSSEIWDGASARFVNSGRSGSWKMKNPENPENSTLSGSWPVELAGLTFSISLSAFKHTGLFPEQSENWSWIEETVSRAVAAMNLASAQSTTTLPEEAKKTISVLNLFGYTGGATLAAAKAGANVTHVDGSKVSVTRAHENAKLSGLDSKPIRWIIDDVMAFVKREVRRGNHYDAIIMDPPAYGHGPKKELWEIETHLPLLIAECQKILSPNPLFIILNGYASGYSAVAYKNNIEDLVKRVGGGAEDNSSNNSEKNPEIEFGELTIEAKTGRLLPSGIFARWRSL